MPRNTVAFFPPLTKHDGMFRRDASIHYLHLLTGQVHGPSLCLYFQGLYTTTESLTRVVRFT